jgi:type II secretory pathway pseudopilin PulG
MTLIETLVVMSLSTVVFGLILNTLVSTQRESDRLANTEQMHQEALLISQSVERVLRYRVSPGELEGVVQGGAGAEAASGGGIAPATTSTLPASIAAISSATLAITTNTQNGSHRTTAPSPTPAATPDNNGRPDRLSPASRAEFTSVPASIQSILGTTATATGPANIPVAPRANAPGQQTVQVKQTSKAPVGQERFATDEVVVYSLSAGPDPGKLVTALRNSRGLGNVPSHAYLEQTPGGSAFAPASRRRSLGPNPDKFQSQVTFRFASTFNGTDAQWTREAHEVPRLVEYTVRVWPIGQSDMPDPAQQHGPRAIPTFQLTSAVAL